MNCIDTHAHLDGEEYAEDRKEMIERAREAGVSKVFLPAIDLPSVERVLAMSREFPHYCYPMIGLHPEEVRADYKDVLSQMHDTLSHSTGFIAIGEVGLDFYWSREFAEEQLDAFEEQVKWSVETRLPLMIHCRKAQNEMVTILKRYAGKLPGGVFHCFTGNSREAEELLRFDGFVLGIGGVLTFKKSHLPEVLREVPLSRIVLETDSPYMAPVPMRGKRNESAYVVYVLRKLAESLGVSEEEVARQTNENVQRVFGIC
ncbi:MAG: TatD family hydrolase [Prevotella sp.]|uniref:TatD family hydrolase n=1 Tax=Prevotella sp. TaxID=59823 RepID=UPI002A2943BA|nr:TatD family hydrolase [Prevotella sp.]MDD7317509.1 TatD family hydrolase [Prevotellaceae bacterium]MDY4019155.1 TatD family hydrolase [Prevotella sp.]